MRDLLKIKESLKIPDPRIAFKEAELCENTDWRPGVQCAVGTAPQATQPTQANDTDLEKLVQTITDRIMIQLDEPAKS